MSLEKDERILLSLTMKKLKTPSGVNEYILKQKGERQGECYRLAASFVLDNEGWLLVHGVINPPRGPYADIDYAHAWCEKKDVVYEPVFNHFYKKADYYKAYLPKVAKKYDKEEARKNLLKYETWGDWS